MTEKVECSDGKDEGNVEEISTLLKFQLLEKFAMQKRF
ncbi:hypothetical protein HMPREF1320_1774 [Capnocytophaga sp. oral taxon 335 str. F0486]|nr:hypothetical protein HMPREF1320_1774 [Capnocytophaga sp. oral taxon 335 str. F0486]